MTANRLQQVVHIWRGRHRLAKSERRDEFAEDRPGSISSLGVVEGSFAGCDFSPAGHTIDARFDQQNAACPRRAETCLKGIAQPNTDFTKCEFFNLHKARADSSHSLLQSQNL